MHILQRLSNLVYFVITVTVIALKLLYEIQQRKTLNGAVRIAPCGIGSLEDIRRL